MKKEFVSPQQGFSHLAKVTANGVTTIYVAGQVGWATGASEAGADIAEQAEIAFTNVLERLAEVGASASDIVKTNVYIKDIDSEKVRAAGGAQARVFQLDPPPVSTWVGVTGLIYSQLLIEVEATAVVEAD
jgi:enamine deaminase RidA (YjgF/YER057c/UK114 family)